jgi:hypothetical protein
MSLYTFNKYTDLSLELAKDGYLDSIRKIYSPASKVFVNKRKIVDSFNLFHATADKNPLQALSDLISGFYQDNTRTVFVKNGLDISNVIESLKAGKDITYILSDNKETARALYAEAVSLPFDVFYDRLATERVSRRLGSAAQRAIKDAVSKNTVSEKSFFSAKSQGTVSFDGNDLGRLDLAKRYFKFESVSDKGLDFVIRAGNSFTCGEAKFVSRQGGSQSNQIKSAMDHLCATTSSSHTVKKVAIIDGWPFYSEDSID